MRMRTRIREVEDFALIARPRNEEEEFNSRLSQLSR